MRGEGGIDTVSYAYETNAVTVNLDTGVATGSGTDTLETFENAEGGSGADNLIGDAVANVLDGQAGADTMEGGFGNDTYVVDDALDVVVETTNTPPAPLSGSGPEPVQLVGEGLTDTIIALINYSVESVAFVENLTLSGTATTGTGNELANVLTGNNLANSLSGLGGNDTIFGAGRADTITGGSGNDTLMATAATTP